MKRRIKRKIQWGRSWFMHDPYYFLDNEI